ncbi:MAG: helix-turn-helix domain-containing protein [Acidobacteria bacterium]|nr:helix-turn-helix domain-containing protein [Acidobacteriota bacterium]
MARPAEWMAKIPGALEVLEDFPAPWLDRAAVAALFAVSQRTAQRLTRRLGGVRTGGGWIVSREVLRARLEELASGAEVEQVVRRRVRIEELVREAGAVARSRRVELPVVAGGGGVLPPTMRVGGGKLEVSFASAVDLLQQLYALVQVAAEDYECFERTIEGTNE